MEKFEDINWVILIKLFPETGSTKRTKQKMGKWTTPYIRLKFQFYMHSYAVEFNSAGRSKKRSKSNKSWFPKIYF